MKLCKNCRYYKPRFFLLRFLDEFKEPLCIHPHVCRAVDIDYVFKGIVYYKNKITCKESRDIWNGYGSYCGRDAIYYEESNL